MRKVVLLGAAAAVAAGLAAALVFATRDGGDETAPRDPDARMQINVVTPPPARAAEGPKLETLPEGTEDSPQAVPPPAPPPAEAAEAADAPRAPWDDEPAEPPDDRAQVDRWPSPYERPEPRRPYEAEDDSPPPGWWR